jgi:hypothetical protein
MGVACGLRSQVGRHGAIALSPKAHGIVHLRLSRPSLCRR